MNNSQSEENKEILEDNYFQSLEKYFNLLSKEEQEKFTKIGHYMYDDLEYYTEEKFNSNI